MEERFLQERLCRKFCRYYKPSKDEGLACLGYRVIDRLSEGGRKAFLPVTVEKPGEAEEKLLAGCMCIRCSFYEDGCDFAQGIQDASPCGGFVVLGHMCTVRDLSVDDVQDIVDLIK